MKAVLRNVPRKRITTAPAGRGWKLRPEIIINAEYVKRLLEENRLTERDEILFHYLDTLPILSSRQIRRLLWFDSSASNMHRRLRQLYDYHLLDRVRMLNKREGIIYTLGKAAKIWLYSDIRGSTKPVVNVNLIKHDLAVAEVFVALTEEIRESDPTGALGLSLDWYGEHQTRILHKDNILLEPDGLVSIRAKARQPSTGFYLEIDMATERRKALESKFGRYYRAARLKYLTYDDVSVSTVVFITTTAARARNIASMLVEYKSVQQDTSTLTWLVSNLNDLRQFGFYGKTYWHGVRHNKIIHRGILKPFWS